MFIYEKFRYYEGWVIVINNDWIIIFIYFGSCFCDYMFGVSIFFFIYKESIFW